MAEIVRFVFAIMLCIANMIIYGLKVNIATTIVGMVKARKVDNPHGDASHECGFDDVAGPGIDIEGPFDWTATEQGVVVSIYFAGYLVGMFPSGYFSDRFNTKNVLLICVLANAILTLLVPVTANILIVLYIVRFLTGVMSAANLPVVNVLVGKWVVYEEKSLWVAIIFAGTSLGTVVSIFTSGMIMNSLGWEAVFYIHGTLPLIWCVVFYWFFEDSPEEQKYISETERQLIVTTYGHRSPHSAKQAVPWKDIFTSIPFWALIYTNTFGNFVWYLLLTQLPLYMNKILRFDIKSNAALSCSPYLINSVVNPVLGKVLDWGRQNGYWSQTNARKIAVFITMQATFLFLFAKHCIEINNVVVNCMFTLLNLACVSRTHHRIMDNASVFRAFKELFGTVFTGCIPSSICLLAIAYVGCNRLASTVLLILSIVLCGAIFVGHLCNHNDLAPNYAGILMGITNTPGSISAFILPAMVGALMEHGHTMARWKIVIWINVVAQISAFIVYVLFGSGEIQEWNAPPARTEE